MGPPVCFNYLLENSVVIVDEIKERRLSLFSSLPALSILTGRHRRRHRLPRRQSSFRHLLAQSQTFISSSCSLLSTWKIHADWTRFLFIFLHRCRLESRGGKQTINNLSSFQLFASVDVSYHSNRQNNIHLDGHCRANFEQQDTRLPLTQMTLFFPSNNLSCFAWFSLIVRGSRNFITRDNCRFSEDLRTWVGYAIKKSNTTDCRLIWLFINEIRM